MLEAILRTQCCSVISTDDGPLFRRVAYARVVLTVFHSYEKVPISSCLYQCLFSECILEPLLFVSHRISACRNFSMNRVPVMTHLRLWLFSSLLYSTSQPKMSKRRWKYVNPIPCERMVTLSGSMIFPCFIFPENNKCRYKLLHSVLTVPVRSTRATAAQTIVNIKNRHEDRLQLLH